MSKNREEFMVHKMVLSVFAVMVFGYVLASSSYDSKSDRTLIWIQVAGYSLAGWITSRFFRAIRSRNAQKEGVAPKVRSDIGGDDKEVAENGENVDVSECPEDVAPPLFIDESMRRHLTGADDCHIDCKEAKPVVYLYPETRTKCNVKVVLDGVLTCTYPDYGTNGWQNFIAAPDGTLTFPDGRKYYCLFWEGRTNSKWDFSRGYCVKGSETASFLADVLAKMGLSFREANEFIIYWLPRMQNNPYNVIAFQGETYTKDAKFEIEPKPDSVLRIFMAWRASDQPINIPEPDIKPFERKGFTVVEWGGTEIDK